MFGIASKRIYWSGNIDFISGSSVGGRIIYLDGSNQHGIAVGPTWYTARSWSSMMGEDGRATNNYGPYRVPTESEFNTRIRPMLNGTINDDLPWGVYSGWPASEQGLDKWWVADEVDANNARAYSVQTDTFVTILKSTSAVGVILRSF